MTSRSWQITPHVVRQDPAGPQRMEELGQPDLPSGGHERRPKLGHPTPRSALGGQLSPPALGSVGPIRLLYRPFLESPAPDSNRRPLPYHGSALPTELAGRARGWTVPRLLGGWQRWPSRPGCFAPNGFRHGASRRPVGLLDSLEQLARRGEPKSAGEDHNRLEPGGALAALEQADLGPVQVADRCERLLGETHAIAVVTKVDGELLAHGFHDSQLSRCANEGATDVCLWRSSSMTSATNAPRYKRHLTLKTKSLQRPTRPAPRRGSRWSQGGPCRTPCWAGRASANVTAAPAASR
jgi:hypothetical protein